MPQSNWLSRNPEPILFANYEIKFNIETEVDGKTRKTLKRKIAGHIDCDKGDRGSKSHPNPDQEQGRIVAEQMAAALNNPEGPEHAELMKEFGGLFGVPFGMKRTTSHFARGAKGMVEFVLIDERNEDAVESKESTAA